MKLKRFVFAYIKSMRLYYAFVTGIAGWLGVSFYNFCMPDNFNYTRSGIILVMLFLSWGVNQIINDYLGLPGIVSMPRTGRWSPANFIQRLL